MKTVLNSFFNFPSILFKSLYDNLPLKRNIELNQTSQKVDVWIENIIKERRNKPNNMNPENQETQTGENKKNKDLLDLILEAENEEKLSLSSKELQNNIFLFFFAGHGLSHFFISIQIYFYFIFFCFKNRYKFFCIDFHSVFACQASRIHFKSIQRSRKRVGRKRSNIWRYSKTFTLQRNHQRSFKTLSTCPSCNKIN